MPHTSVCHAHLAVVGQADHQRLVGEAGAFHFFIQLVDEEADLPIDQPQHVAVEIEVLLLLVGALEEPERQVGCDIDLRLCGGLVVAGQVFVDRLRQLDGPLQEVVVVAVVEPFGIAEHIVRVDEREHQAIGLHIAAGAPLAHALQVGDGLLHIRLVVVGEAAAEVLGRRILTGIGGDPAFEAIHRNIRRTGSAAVFAFAQVPLAAVLYIVTGVVEHARHVGQCVVERDLGVGVAAALGERLRDVVLRRVSAGKQRSPAGRAHAGITESALEAEAVALKERKRGQVVLLPIVGEVLRGTFLVGDDEDEIGFAGQVAEAFAECHGVRCE